MFGQLAQLVAGALINVDLIIPQEDLVVLPFVERGKVVPAHDEDEIPGRIFLFQVNQRIYCIRRFRQGEFDVGSFEPEVVAYFLC